MHYSDTYKYNPKNFVDVKLIRTGEDSFFSNKTGRTNLNQTTHNMMTIRDLNLTLASENQDAKQNLRGTTSQVVKNSN